jgi:hypothetical protein
VTELAALRRLKLVRPAQKHFSPLLLPPGFAGLAPCLAELVLEGADWPAIPQVPPLANLSSDASWRMHSLLLLQIAADWCSAASHAPSLGGAQSMGWHGPSGPVCAGWQDTGA